jgi:hypothetical protein
MLQKQLFALIWHRAHAEKWKKFYKKAKFIILIKTQRHCFESHYYARSSSNVYYKYTDNLNIQDKYAF